VDAEEVLSWIAEQPWCDGHTGMMGISWGGFNALQVAARRPESLRAIVTASSSDDRYSDDVHYMGGCLLGDNLSWPPPCSPTTPAPRTRPWWGNAGGRCGTSGWSTAVCGSTRGCATNTATSTGSTVPSPRTWVLYRYRSWPSVGGPTAIPTPCSV